MQKYGYSMNCPGCRSVMTEECRRRLEECLAEDEETKFREESVILCVDGWLAGRVESAESHAPSGAAISSATAVTSGGCSKNLSASI